MRCARHQQRTFERHIFELIVLLTKAALRVITTINKTILPSHNFANLIIISIVVSAFPVGSARKSRPEAAFGWLATVQPQRRSPKPIPKIPARRRSAPTVRFISLEIFATGVRALEWALRLRTSSFVHGLITRRAVLDDAVFFATSFFVGAFLAISILQLKDRYVSIKQLVSS